MYWFTADEHYGHKNVLAYCKRPFSSIHNMDIALIQNHNNVVSTDDTTFHLGDFTLIKNKKRVQQIIQQLNGTHIFIKGSHDYWIPKKCSIQLLEKTIEGVHVTMCHYAMHVWPRSHYNSWHIFGHSHGALSLPGKRWDVGVDNNNYMPVSMSQLRIIMDKKSDNINLVKGRV